MFQGVYVVAYSYRRTLEKLEVPVTSLVCILDVWLYFFDVIYDRTYLNECPD